MRPHRLVPFSSPFLLPHLELGHVLDHFKEDYCLSLLCCRHGDTSTFFGVGQRIDACVYGMKGYSSNHVRACNICVVVIQSRVSSIGQTAIDSMLYAAEGLRGRVQPVFFLQYGKNTS